MRGRKPKPTALKILQGNAGKREINGDEPQPSSELPSCPGWLAGEAKAEWRRVALELHECGVLTLIDRAVLAAYCQAWARWAQAEKLLEEKGLIVEVYKEDPDSGQFFLVQVRERPEVGISRKYGTLMRSYASELGLSPSARTRLKVEQPDEGNDPAEEYLRGLTGGRA